jgi:alkylhydroperoxidase/carboxymuconolactone decarboxylase family protein YurZ
MSAAYPKIPAGVCADEEYDAGMSHSHGKAVQEELAPIARDLRQMIPDTYAGFAALHKGAMADGAVPSKTKELIAVRQGATKEEVAEAIGVTFLMAGGPATVYGPRAYSAFCEFFDAANG